MPTLEKSKPKLDISSDADPEPSKGDLSRVSAMAQALQQKYAQAARIMEELELIKEEIERIESADLPGLMTELGLKDFRLVDGSRITIKDILKASIPTETAIAKQKDELTRDAMQDRFDRALQFLEDQGAGSLIKSTLSAELGKDSAELAAKALAALRKLKVEASLAKGVHPQSLTSWVKERMAAGQPVDEELLGVYSGQRAIIESPKFSPGTRTNLKP